MCVVVFVVVVFVFFNMRIPLLLGSFYLFFYNPTFSCILFNFNQSSGRNEKHVLVYIQRFIVVSGRLDLPEHIPAW